MKTLIASEIFIPSEQKKNALRPAYLYAKQKQTYITSKTTKSNGK